MSTEAKTEARQRAFAARKVAKSTVAEEVPRRILAALLDDHAGRPLAGYMPIRTEIDPIPVMASWTGPVGVPVIRGAERPLDFARWRPETEMVDGPFGARIPREPVPVTPEVLIVPLLAFSEEGYRLGYGGGFYDRTLERLRADGPVFAVGFAFEVQRLDDLPTDPTDQRLDALVTEAGVRRFR